MQQEIEINTKILKNTHCDKNTVVNIKYPRDFSF